MKFILVYSYEDCAALLAFPEELVERIYEDAHAETLMEALFGKLSELKDGNAFTGRFHLPCLAVVQISCITRKTRKNNAFGAKAGLMMPKATTPIVASEALKAIPILAVYCRNDWPVRHGNGRCAPKGICPTEASKREKA